MTGDRSGSFTPPCPRPVRDCEDSNPGLKPRPAHSLRDQHSCGVPHTAERQRNEAAKKRKKPPKNHSHEYPFYQVMPTAEILFSVPIWPASLSKVDEFILNEYGWGV